MTKKLERLKKTLRSYESVLIAFSGGVDSTFLLRMAIEVLDRRRVCAVTAVSVLYPSREISMAKRVAKSFGVRHIIIRSSIVKNKKFITNPPHRCYICKRALLTRCHRLAKRLKLNVVCDAGNVDDLGVYRPGNKAARELAIKRPLAECGLHKKDVRTFSRKLKLPTWNSPSNSCLATRFPYGKRLSVKELARVDKGEEALRRLGFSSVRLRYYEQGVRIEVAKQEIEKLLHKSVREQCIIALKRYGFHYITLDLEGYRSGSMDENL